MFLKNLVMISVSTIDFILHQYWFYFTSITLRNLEIFQGPTNRNKDPGFTMQYRGTVRHVIDENFGFYMFWYGDEEYE